MQQLLCPFGVRFAEVLFVAFNDRRILVAEAQLRIGVDVAQDKFTFGCAFAALVDGLAAAANAAAQGMP